MALKVKHKFRGGAPNLTDENVLNNTNPENNQETGEKGRGGATIVLKSHELNEILADKEKNTLAKEHLKQKPGRKPKNEDKESLHINSVLHKRIKIITAINGGSIKDWIEEALVHSVEKEEKKLGLHTRTEALNVNTNS